MILPHLLWVFHKQCRSSFLGIVLSNQFVFNFTERALRKRESGVAQIPLSDLPLQEQRDKEG